MHDFTAGGIHALSSQRKSSGDALVDQQIRELVASWGCGESSELVEQLVASAFKVARDKVSVADLKLFNRSLNELRYAARVFAPFRDSRKVAVFGSARTRPEEQEFAAAEAFGQRMRESGYMIVTGGGDGIMGAAQRGAGRDHSFGLNIRLPFEQRANEVIDGDPKLINFNYFFTRKLNFLKETHAVALFPGGFGTMDEGFEVLTLMQTGKARILPVVLVDKPGGRYWETWMRFLREHLLQLGLVSENDFHLFTIAPDVEAAVAEIEGFYRNFRSYRWVGQRMVIRLAHRITDAEVVRISDEFKDLLKSSAVVACEALPEEANEPDLAGLPRLVLTPDKRDFGRIRQFINAVNAAEWV